MKKFLAAIMAVCAFMSVSFGQTISYKRPAAIGVSFFLNDFATAQKIRSTSLSKVLGDKQWSKFKDMSPGLAFSYFKGLTEQILEQWAIHEEWVLQAKQQDDSAILTVKLEDLWSDSVTTMTEVLRFLDLKMTDGFADLITQIVYPKDPNIKYASFALPEVPRARRIMELYSY